MNQVVGLISCGICFCANTYMAKHTKQPWLRTAALLTATLCVVGMCLDIIVLSIVSMI